MVEWKEVFREDFSILVQTSAKLGVQHSSCQMRSHSEIRIKIKESNGMGKEMEVVESFRKGRAPLMSDESQR